MRRLVLIGFACSYKTSVGKMLAERLNVVHYDTDELVSAECGMSAGELIDCGGQQALRDAERAVVERLPETDCIVSCGGGVPLNDSTMQMLKKQSIVVWLRVSASTVRARLKDSKEYRPLHQTLDDNKLIAFVQQRDSIYKLYADIALFTDGKTSKDVTDSIYNMVKGVLMH